MIDRSASKGSRIDKQSTVKWLIIYQPKAFSECTDNTWGMEIQIAETFEGIGWMLDIGDSTHTEFTLSSLDDQAKIELSKKLMQMFFVFQCSFWQQGGH